MVMLSNLPVNAAKKRHSNDVFYLSVFFKNAKPNDTLTITMDNMVYALYQTKSNHYQSSTAQEGYFKFEIPIKQSHGLFSLWKNRTSGKTPGTAIRMLLPQFWEAGDSLTLSINFTERRVSSYWFADYEFSGRGCEKYNLVHSLNKMGLEKVDSTLMNTEPSFYTFKKLSILKDHQNKISDLSYSVIEADIIYADQLTEITKLNQSYVRNFYDKMDDNEKKRIKSTVNTAINNVNRFGLSNESLLNSIGYFKFLAASKGLLRTASIVNTGTESVDEIFDSIKKQSLSPRIKETLMTVFLWKPKKYPDDVDAVFNEAKLYVTDPIYLKLLSDSHLKCINKNLTDFELEDTNGLTTSYKDFKNKVLIMDFWFTGCGGCSSYYKNVLSIVKERFKNNPNVIFLSISIDKDKANWKRSIAKEIYTSKDAVNVYTNGLGSNHMLVKNNNIKAFPCVVLLDKNGNLKLYNSKDLYQSESFIESIKHLL